MNFLFGPAQQKEIILSKPEFAATSMFDLHAQSIDLSTVTGK